MTEYVVFFLVAESRLVQPDGCDQQACSECLFLLLNDGEFALPVHLECDYLGYVALVILRLNKFFWNIVESLGFCSCCGHPAMYLFNTSLRDHSGGVYLCMNVSGDVCVTKLCLAV